MWALFDVTDPENPIQISDAYLRCSLTWVPEYTPVGSGDPPSGGPVGGLVGPRRFQHPSKTPTPQKTQKQKAYDDCFNKEMEGATKKLEKLMNRNLKYTGSAGLIGAALGGVTGALGAMYVTLDMWRDELKDFDEEIFTPARNAAKEKCTKQVGL